MLESNSYAVDWILENQIPMQLTGWIKFLCSWPDVRESNSYADDRMLESNSYAIDRMLESNSYAVGRMLESNSYAVDRMLESNS